MKITKYFSKTLYVECTPEILTNISNNLKLWAIGKYRIATTFSDLEHFLDNEESKKNEELYTFISELKNNLWGYRSNIIFLNKDEIEDELTE